MCSLLIPDITSCERTLDEGLKSVQPQVQQMDPESIENSESLKKTTSTFFFGPAVFHILSSDACKNSIWMDGTRSPKRLDVISLGIPVAYTQKFKKVVEN